MKITTALAAAAFGAAAFSSAAFAVSLTPPIERAGLDTASPLPEGVYFIDIGILGGSPLDPNYGSSSFNGNVPILAWSTPWTILGGRLEFLAAIPEAEAGFNGTKAGVNTQSYKLGMYNEFLAGELAWNLGNGFAFSYLAGVYLPSMGAGTWTAAGVNLFDNSTFHQMASLSWHGDGWNFAGNVQYGIVGNTANSSVLAPAIGKTGNIQALWGDYVNYDVSLTKTIGKWEVGVIGYGSFDTSTTYINSFAVGTAACTSAGQSVRGSALGCGKQSQFALGGLVGYNFGPVITQFTLANDVYEQNYGRYNTQAAIKIIVPLWNPEAPKAVVAKY